MTADMNTEKPMYQLILFSIMRDSAEYIDRYFEQVTKLFVRAFPGHSNKLLVVLEGDSKDDTKELLDCKCAGFAWDYKIVSMDVGGRKWLSVDHVQRWKQLIACWNACLAQQETCERAIVVESDLIWKSEVPLDLLNAVGKHGDVILPMLMCDRAKELFYDLNACSRFGISFSENAPYIPGWDEKERYVELSTGGGMLVMSSEALSKAKWANRCVLGYAPETKIVIDTAQRIYHP